MDTNWQRLLKSQLMYDPAKDQYFTREEWFNPVRGRSETIDVPRHPPSFHEALNKVRTGSIHRG